MIAIGADDVTHHRIPAERVPEHVNRVLEMVCVEPLRKVGHDLPHLEDYCEVQV